MRDLIKKKVFVTLSVGWFYLSPQVGWAQCTSANKLVNDFCIIYIFDIFTNLFRAVIFSYFCGFMIFFCIFVRHLSATRWHSGNCQHHIPNPLPFTLSDLLTAGTFVFSFIQCTDCQVDQVYYSARHLSVHCTLVYKLNVASELF